MSCRTHRSDRGGRRRRRRPIACGTAASAGYYFVDFRARPGGVFGHTFVVYGRMDGRGRVRQPRYAGLYPDGVLSQTALLALLAVPGNVRGGPADHHRRPDVIYRRRISAAAYARLAGTVHHERKMPQTWDLIFYNCNSFAAEVASSIGLRTPPTFEFPTDFVRDLYVMNCSNGVVRAPLERGLQDMAAKPCIQFPRRFVPLRSLGAFRPDQAIGRLRDTSIAL